tara:strand:+ start:29 stop:211 length:183 start_codon:yes stop_codon:yes gene_type:complete
MKKYNAQQMIDELFQINRRLAEQVLDTISDGNKASGTWDRDDDGNMILLTYEEADEVLKN